MRYRVEASSSRPSPVRPRRPRRSGRPRCTSNSSGPCSRLRSAESARSAAPVYFTDRGIEELEARRGDEEVTYAWLADQLRTFVDLNPDFETAVERLATWLARLYDPEALSASPRKVGAGDRFTRRVAVGWAHFPGRWVGA